MDKVLKKIGSHRWTVECCGETHLFSRKYLAEQYFKSIEDCKNDNEPKKVEKKVVEEKPVEENEG